MLFFKIEHLFYKAAYTIHAPLGDSCVTYTSLHGPQEVPALPRRWLLGKSLTNNARVCRFYFGVNDYREVTQTSNEWQLGKHLNVYITTAGIKAALVIL